MAIRPLNCSFELVEGECDARKITIRDTGDWEDAKVSEDVNAVVYWLYINGILGDPDRPLRLFYYDSRGKKDEIIHNGKGEFVNFQTCH